MIPHIGCTIRRSICIIAMLAILFAISSRTARAATTSVTIVSPDDGAVVTAEVCPFTICTGSFDWEVDVTGAPMEEVVVHFTHTTIPARSFDQPLCIEDPIEQIHCPTPPHTFTRPIKLLEGKWTATVEVVRDSGSESAGPIDLEVLEPHVTPPGTIALKAVTPTEGSTPIVLREASGSDPAILSETTEVTITGENLDNNPFIEVYARADTRRRGEFDRGKRLAYARLLSLPGTDHRPRCHRCRGLFPQGESAAAAAGDPNEMWYFAGASGFDLCQRSALADSRQVDSRRART